MKKIILLTCAALAVLFTGCKQPNDKVRTTDTTTTTIVEHSAVLAISNQTSTDFSSVIYNGTKKITSSTTIGTGHDAKTIESGTELTRGSSWKVPQNDTPCSSYIYFTAGSLKARTDELITLEKGDNKIFTFTDNTLVVKDGEKKAIPMSEARTATTVLIIQNNTSQAISAVTYAGKHPENTAHTPESESYTIKKSEQGRITLDDSCSAVLYFDMRSLHFKTEEKISINKGENKLYIIDGDTLVIAEGYPYSNKLSHYL